MLLIVEIGLTVWACIRLKKAKKGWAWGLLPIAVGLVMAFLTGFAIGVSTGDISSAGTIGLIFDAAILIAQIWIIIAAKPKIS